MSSAMPVSVAIVDDDKSVCQSFGRLLRAGDIQSVAYASAEAFLADARRHRFDCLVLDIELGGMSGIELGRRLAAEGEHTPFIYVTGHDNPKARAEAEAAGCSAYFRKADSGEDVVEVIRRLAAQST
jgi:FixJ family two-component response regulator